MILLLSIYETVLKVKGPLNRKQEARDFVDAWIKFDFTTEAAEGLSNWNI